MKNKSSFIVCGVTLGALLCICTLADAAQVTFTIPNPGNSLSITTKIVADVIGTVSDTKPTTATGDLSANLDVSVDSATRRISATGIGFIQQTPGHISLTPMTFHLKKSIIFIGTVLDETIQSSTLLATPNTPSPPTALTASGSSFTFPVSSTQLVINQGTINASGTTAYFVDCAQTPITTAMQSGNGTVSFTKTIDTLTSLVYSINLNVPISFDNVITTGTVSTIVGNLNYTVSMSGSGTLNANTGTYTRSFANTSVYWDTNTATGLQAGNGTWSTTSQAWSTGIQGSSPLYAWTADAGTLDANFNLSGTSAVTVSGSVAAKSLNINGAGYSFTGGTITVNSGGIEANQSATIGSAINLGAAQAWSIASDMTLTVSGRVSGSSTLTFNGPGTTRLTGTIAYTGPTIINDGTLVIDNNLTTTLSVISGTGDLNIRPTSTLNATSIHLNSLSIGSAGAAAVPEPGSLVLLAVVGIFGGFSFMRSRQ